MTTQTAAYGLVHEALINGETYHVYRQFDAAEPYAEVKVQRGPFAIDRRPDYWVNSQYGVVSTDRGAVEVAVHEPLVAAARAYFVRYHQAKDAADAARAAQELAELEAILDAPPLPADVAALARRYGSSERAWEAEDETAWALLREYDL